MKRNEDVALSAREGTANVPSPARLPATFARRMMMIRNASILIAVLFEAGCAAAAGGWTDLSPDHPANPKAVESSYTPPSNVLGTSTPPGEPAPSRNVMAQPGTIVKLDSVSEDVRKSLEDMLGIYERIRALLAADKVEGLPDFAGKLEQVAKTLMGTAPPSLLEDLKAFETASQQLVHAEHVGLEASRKTFGELSRYAIRLSAAVPNLAQSRKVYKCLMLSKGYAKWIQTGLTISNPYLGKEMLECGNESEWKE